MITGFLTVSLKKIEIAIYIINKPIIVKTLLITIEKIGGRMPCIPVIPKPVVIVSSEQVNNRIPLNSFL